MNISFIVSLFIPLFYIYFKSKKIYQMFQQNWYNEGNRYLKWISKNIKKTFINLDLLFIFFWFVEYLDFRIAMCLFIIYYMALSLILLHNRRGEQNKKALAITSRVKRLYVTMYILYLIPCIIIYNKFNYIHLNYYYVIFGGLIYFEWLVVLVANTINIPIESIIRSRFKNKAIKKLKQMENLDVIGITGSYGKTSSKNILSDILNVKYNALPTPKNFNTPLGITITINNYLDKFNDFFIAEMGAFKKGEIKELCDLVNPKYGILTRIGTAHMESFGSQENIQEGKFELIESLPEDGIGILNADDDLQVNYDLKNDVRIVWIGIEKDADVKASNIKLSNLGTTFDVSFKGDKKKYKFETKLLGYANVYNILAGIALGNELGIPKEQLQLGVKKVNQVEHRLQLKKYYDINIIDDAYNSNPVGSKMALDVLKTMPGKKIIVTPGMIELGEKQDELNEKFGEYIADSVDEVILVGEEQTKMIYKGLVKKKFKEDKIHIINDVKLAFNMMLELKEDETYVLLENDLPDIFNEK